MALYQEPRFEAPYKLPHTQSASHRRTRTLSVSAINPGHAYKHARDIQSRHHDIAHEFSPEYSSTWRDLGPRNAWAVAQREQERLLQHEAERALYYHRRAEERKSREQRASVDRTYSRRDQVVAFPGPSSVIYPSGNAPRNLAQPKRHHTSRITDFPSTRDRHHANGGPSYAVPNPDSSLSRHVSQTRYSVDPDHAMVCNVAMPPPRHRRESLFSRLNPFKRSRSQSISEVHHHYHHPMAANSGSKPGRMRRTSATPGVNY
ncbi:hypothetical protein BJ138DRAFT_1114665 [Hygrophoropsis aurantiaca]|uniref:Uncharacterized protein n=1 Tax=Hygrophoropsis aurantiaca TaxID=72124 RepID=A0ACB8A8M0_9AGAM|nr:hypothetical protein BJ138DRAFT_1114665 [Hygrophoropsis aurantiaca]